MSKSTLQNSISLQSTQTEQRHKARGAHALDLEKIITVVIFVVFSSVLFVASFPLSILDAMLHQYPFC